MACSPFREVRGDRPVDSSMSPLTEELTVQAFRRPARAGLDVVAVNPGALDRQLKIQVARPQRPRSAAVLRLTGPGVDARTGVRLGGRPVRRSGAWGPARPARVAVRNGIASVRMPAESAGLIRLER